VLTNKFRIFYSLIIILCLLSMAGCENLLATPTPTLAPSKTPAPTKTPVPSDTPLPSLTFTATIIPTETFTIMPPLPTEPPKPTATPDTKDAILLYFINKDQQGPWGCNEALWYVNTGISRTKNVEGDIRTALYRLLTYHTPTIGILYNAGYASTLAVNQIKVEDEGTTYAWLTGSYVKTKDPCDGPRFRDMIKQTIKQFKLVKAVIVYINGTPIGDVMSRK
jgi:hypothetical protein